MRKPRKPAPIVDLDNLPAVLTIREIAAVIRSGISTIRQKLRVGTFHPRPWRTAPVRWTREDVLADLKRQRDEPPQGGQGATAAKAPLLTPRRAPRRKAS